ncbi:UNVERIFIED_CONTAM: hypothetical protein K2H54_057558 [Gekko kuhli]
MGCGDNYATPQLRKRWADRAYKRKAPTFIPVTWSTELTAILNKGLDTEEGVNFLSTLTFILIFTFSFILKKCFTLSFHFLFSSFKLLLKFASELYEFSCC